MYLIMIFLRLFFFFNFKWIFVWIILTLLLYLWKVIGIIRRICFVMDCRAYEDMFLPKCSHKINELVRFSKSVSVLHSAYMSISKRNLWLDSSQGLHPVQPDWKQAILAALFFTKVRKYSIIETETSTTKKPLTFQKKETKL